MLVFDNYEDFSEFREGLSSKTVGFVPTMGALHFGHLHLAETSVANCETTLVSIWVNPRQFNDSDDFDKYPRNLDQDLEKLKSVKVDAVFAPKTEERIVVLY